MYSMINYLFFSLSKDVKVNPILKKIITKNTLTFSFSCGLAILKLGLNINFIVQEPFFYNINIQRKTTIIAKIISDACKKKKNVP